jgi:hypothetical protein
MPVYAVPPVVKRSRRLLPGRVIETEVQRAIRDGFARIDRQGLMIEAPHFVARLSPRCSWLNPDRPVWWVMWIGPPE